MKKLLTVFALLTLTGYAWAGPTVYSRFGIGVNAGDSLKVLGKSTFKDVIAIAARVDSATMIFPDTTFALRSAKRLLTIDLLNPEQTWSFSHFHSYFDSTGLGRVRGDTAMAATPVWEARITAGADSVVISDLLTGKILKTWVPGTNNLLQDATPVLTGLDWRDGELYWCGSGGANLTILDFCTSVAYQYSTSGVSIYNGTLQQGNDGLGWTVISASPAIASNTVNAVSVIRDVFGKTDGLGRACQWWVAAQGSGASGATSTYNPYNKGIWDGSLVRGYGTQALLASGSLVTQSQNATPTHQIFWDYSIFPEAADGYISYDGAWDNTGTGSDDLAWGNATLVRQLSALPDGLLNGSPTVYVGADSGLYVLQSKANDNTNGGKVLIEDGFQSPYQVGDCFLAWPGASSADASPYNSALTNVGTPVYATASVVFSGAFSGKVATALKRVGDADFNLGTADFSVTVAIKSKSATNPAATEQIWYLQDARNIDRIQLYFNTSGYLVFSASDDEGVSADAVTTGADWYDAIWHAVECQRSSGTLYMYVDGKLAGSAAISAAALTMDPDMVVFSAASSAGTTSNFNGYLAQGAFAKDPWTVPLIEAEYAANMASLKSNIDPQDAVSSTAITAVAAIPGWVATVEDAVSDSVTVWQQIGAHLIPFARYGSPGGTINDVQLSVIPGAQTPRVDIGAATGVRWIQPDPTLAAYAAYQWPFVQPQIGSVVEVDSAGVTGIFYDVDSAIDAAANAGRREVHINVGTLPYFDADQPLMRITGEGNRTIINGGTTDDAIDVTATGDTVYISNLAVITTAGGGNAYSGVEVVNNAVGWTLEHVAVLGSDDIGFDVQGGQGSLLYNHVVNADGKGIYFSVGGSSSRAIGCAVFSSGATAIRAGSGVAGISILGCEAQHATLGLIEAGTGSSQISIVGNVTNAGVVDNGTGDANVGNVQY